MTVLLHSDISSQRNQLKGLPHNGEFMIAKKANRKSRKNRNSRSEPHDCNHYLRTTRVSRSHMTEVNETA